MPRLVLLSAALIALAAWACGDPTTSTFCRFDSDCPEVGDRFCLKGVCQPEECKADRDCPGSAQCDDGACTP